MSREPVSFEVNVMSIFREHVARAAAVLRGIVGAPDYERYLAHMSECNPGERPLTPDAFARQRMEDRYSRPGSRCC